MTARPAQGHGQVRALLWHALATHLGLFALVPFLPVVLSEEYKLPAGAVGGVLLMFNVLMRGSSVLLDEFIQRGSARGTAVGGLVAAGTCLFALAGVRHAWAVTGLLALAACGVSVSGVVARAMLATAVHEREGRAVAFAKLSVVANVASGTAPLAVGWLADHRSGAAVFVVSGCCYLLGALVLAMFVRGGGARGRDPAGGRSPLRLAPYVTLWREQRPLLTRSVVFWFFYAQQFAALPVLLSRLTGSGVVIGSVYTLSAVVVVVVQVPLTTSMVRRFGERSPAGLGAVFPIGMGCFALQLALLAAGAPSLPLVYAASGLVAVAVMVVVPVMDTLFAELAPDGRQVTAFNARKVTWAVGEGTGAFVGVSCQLWLAATVGIRAYWWAMAVVAALCGLGMLCARSASRRAQPASGDSESS